MTDAAPPWAYEQVALSAHDPRWAETARSECATLAEVLGPSIEHIGSTAVPGLVAKPIVDLMAAVADPADHPRWAEQLAFRDRLRADPQLARDYAALKRRLAVAHADDREAYTEGKAAFIARS
ncbi:GrpB family protein [Cryptosporangium phraense]|uniref:GrpB family protein n=1 Tax=Cryptosporangium phraense TaxID=2593070 RepID=A0A545AEQ9_9ACTN|nr:GrpB family protein [Cryptosporangium phraense]TQS39816.1 GrpB family protein [Cryptosporangium phraense]